MAGVVLLINLFPVSIQVDHMVASTASKNTWLVSSYTGIQYHLPKGGGTDGLQSEIGPVSSRPCC